MGVMEPSTDSPARLEDDMDVADPARSSHWERKSLPGISGPMRAP
jgi:hypothetical protein